MKQKYEPGSVNMKEVKESVGSIEFYTNLYKKRRITTDQYVMFIHQNLSKLTCTRNYLEYLKNIGQ